MNAILTATERCLHKFVTFSGRASRSEYWYFFLFQVLLYILLDIIAVLSHILGFLVAIEFFVFFLPNLSVIVRRLHDINKSGWWYWIVLIPLVGYILLLVWQCTRGTDGENRFGADPLSYP